MKQCPFCGEEIQDTAKKCRYCGEWLNNEAPNNSRRQTQNKTAKPQKRERINVPCIWPDAFVTSRILFLIIGGLLVFFEFYVYVSDPCAEDPTCYSFSAISDLILAFFWGITLIQLRNHKCATTLCIASSLLLIVFTVACAIVELKCGPSLWIMDGYTNDYHLWEFLTWIKYAALILLMVLWLRDYSGRVKTAGWIIIIGFPTCFLLGKIFLDYQEEAAVAKNLLELYALFAILFGDTVNTTLRDHWKLLQVACVSLILAFTNPKQPEKHEEAMERKAEQSLTVINSELNRIIASSGGLVRRGKSSSEIRWEIMEYCEDPDITNLGIMSFGNTDIYTTLGILGMVFVIYGPDDEEWRDAVAAGIQDVYY